MQKLILFHLEQIGDPSALPILRQKTPQDTASKIEYLRTRGKLGDREAFPLLMALLEDNSLYIDTREDIITALEKICFGKAQWPLMGMSDNNEIASDEIRTRRISNAVQVWKQWWDSCSSEICWNRDKGDWNPTPTKRY
jgi:hypothetical protein